MADDALHIEELSKLDGFNASFLDSYLELAPDGEYLEMEQADAPVADDSYLAVQPDWLDEQYSMMTAQQWFRKKPFGRKEAEDELKGKPVGSFLVRVSSQDGNYAISVVRPGPSVEHMLVLPSYAGPNSTAPGKTQYRIGTYSTDLFNTIPKLIAYYIAHPYYQQEKLIGLVMPEEQDGGFYFDVKPVM
eukprot:TRINITY_DN11719_c0_g2_i3.p1 TRINITY_DN11719_c0_g2~~TRINITY_DN11719_c0_g2_i3.p1  ORF type:complete len:189 (+),score=67.13 TRINITY_DN11719_c0_g2_i3:60-626(+)